MSRLPQLERDLVDAAARCRRRRFAALLPRVVRPALALTTAAIAVFAFTLAAGQRDPEREVTARPGVERVPEATFAKSERLTRADLAGARPAIAHPDLAETAARFEADTPYPPGREDDFHWDATPSDPRHLGSITAPGDVQRLVEYRAVCRWFEYWLAAHAAGDTGARADADRVLGDSRSWPSSRQPADNRHAIIEAAARGEAWRVREEVKANCGAPPDPAQRYESPPETGYEYATKPRTLARLGDRYAVVGYMLDPPTDGGPSLCLDLIVLSDGTGSGCHSPTERAQGTSGRPKVKLATGATMAEVDTITVRYRDAGEDGAVRAILGRAEERAALEPLGIAPFTFYVAELPPDAEPTEAVATRDGREVWRARFP